MDRLKRVPIEGRIQFLMRNTIYGDDADTSSTKYYYIP